jgi:trimethylguanosine synthase
MEKNLCPVPASQLMNEARKVTKFVVMYLPRNADVQQLTSLAGINGSVEIEKCFLDEKLIALTAYFVRHMK